MLTIKYLPGKYYYHYANFKDEERVYVETKVGWSRLFRKTHTANGLKI